jgi:hypothetical protein
MEYPRSTFHNKYAATIARKSCQKLAGSAEQFQNITARELKQAEVAAKFFLKNSIHNHVFSAERLAACFGVTGTRCHLFGAILALNKLYTQTGL